ncbi:PIN domain-containing protein [Lacihabitans sp. LS3-19]|uniref:PIN domain-containing protein n=1 Tax=Lacihabitans sp. LS3-19 TaxID=2487335 RepID=UPI0034D95C85
MGIENLFISEITAFELKYGAELSDSSKKSHELLNNFLDGLAILQIFNTLDLYGKEKVRLRKIGKPVHDEFDFLIGLSAIKNELTLVTENIKDFVNLENLKIENWINR